MALNDREKKVAIHQPNYIPWLGYFYKIWKADIFVFLDDAQYSNKGMHNFHYLKTSQGPLRLKIPVYQSFGDMIFEVKTKDELGWKERHLKAIKTNYTKAKHFEEVFYDFQLLLDTPYKNLAETNINIIKFLCKKLGISCNFAVSSDFSFNSTKTQKIIDICKKVGATKYYSGLGAKAYQKEADFLAAGIQLEYTQYAPVQYKQLWGNEFQANVTILDYLMNHGYNWSVIIEKQS